MAATAKRRRQRQRKGETALRPCFANKPFPRITTGWFFDGTTPRSLARPEKPCQGDTDPLSFCISSGIHAGR